MKKIFTIWIIIIAAAAGGILWWLKSRPIIPVQPPEVSQTKPMQITSLAFENNQSIPIKYTCDGDGVNPPLTFKDLPEGVKSLALIIDDPDAPAGTWTHWLVWNISPESREVAENSVPFGAIVGQGSNGQSVYGGACPPSGMHRYFFKLYALDTKLSIPTYSLQADLEKAISGHILGQAELVGLYGRSK